MLMRHRTKPTVSFTRRLLLLLVPALMLGTASRASDSPVTRYHYGRSDIDLRLHDNRAAIDTLFQRLDAALRHPGRISLRLDAYSSPEGSAVANSRLSEKRARLLLEYIRSRVAVPDSILTVRSHGVDWEGLESLVSGSDMPYKEEVLAILRDTPEWIFDDSRRVVDGRKRQLGMLRGGRPYVYLSDNMFPLLRRSCVTVTIDKEDAERPVEKPAGENLPAGRQTQADTRAETEQHREASATHPGETALPAAEKEEAEVAGKPAVPPRGQDGPFRPVLAVKTNLLEWAGVMPDFHRYTFVPNLELEYYFLDRWSVSGKGSYIKRGYGGGRFFAVSSWSLEPRWWPWGDGRFRWLYLGVYGQAGDYDVQNDRVTSDGSTGRFWSTGLSLGAAIPFTDRVGVDVGLRGGYRHSTVRDYTREAGTDYLDRAGTKNHWGVTGINVSLYWRFGKTTKRQRP